MPTNKPTEYGSGLYFGPSPSGARDAILPYLKRGLQVFAYGLNGNGVIWKGSQFGTGTITTKQGAYAGKIKGWKDDKVALWIELDYSVPRFVLAHEAILGGVAASGGSTSSGSGSSGSAGGSSTWSFGGSNSAPKPQNADAIEGIIRNDNTTYLKLAEAAALQHSLARVGIGVSSSKALVDGIAQRYNKRQTDLQSQGFWADLKRATAASVIVENILKPIGQFFGFGLVPLVVPVAIGVGSIILGIVIGSYWRSEESVSFKDMQDINNEVSRLKRMLPESEAEAMDEVVAKAYDAGRKAASKPWYSSYVTPALLVVGGVFAYNNVEAVKTTVDKVLGIKKKPKRR